jgi:hypothetical protein
MEDRNSKLDAAAAAARQLQTRRRAKRGVVAGYIHEISARHQHGAALRAQRPEHAALVAAADGRLAAS